jgi:hypothetical protein
MAGNMLTDALAFGTGSTLLKMPKYRAAMQAENRAAQEAVANQWDNMISRGTSTQVPSSSTANPGSMVLFERPTSSLSARERLGLPKGSKVYTEAENQQFLKQINDFAGKYGYPGLEEGTYSVQELESYARALIDKHNSYYRGVVMPEGEDLEKIYNVLGRDATEDEILKYMTTHPKDNEGWLFMSPKTNAAIYGKTARVSRPYSLGADRTKWFEEGDFPMVMKEPNMSWEEFRQYQGMADPWAKMRHDYYGNPVLDTTVPNEVVSSNQPMIFREWSNVEMPLSNKTATIEYTRPTVTTTPEITAENAASVTPEQWDAAQKVAWEAGDLAERQRLRDLHFKVSAPDTKVNTKVYHGNRTDNNVVSFDRSKIGSEHKDVGLNGFWFIDNPEIAKWEYARKPESWGKGIENAQFGEVIPAYINLKNPVQMKQLGLRIVESPYGDYPSADESIISLFNRAKSKETVGNDGFIFRLIDSYGNTEPMYESIQNQFVVKDPSKIKRADAVTYDDNGVRIPLGERDNFNINDIRYGLLPFGMGLTGYGLYNSGK